jgi:Holliday junction resolvase RusA-like endonuclease
MAEASRKVLFEFEWFGKAVGVNRRYVGRQYRLNPAYRGFKTDLAFMCLSQNMGLSRSPSHSDIQLLVTLKISSNRDADNLIKPLFDAIQASGVIKNDKQIRQYNVHTLNKKRGAPDVIHVTAWALEE